MMVVVPPAAAARLPLSKSSQKTEPSAVSWSKWTWASMPPGTAIRPVASISRRPLSSRSPSATTRPPEMPISPFTTSEAVAMVVFRMTRSYSAMMVLPVDGVARGMPFGGRPIAA